MEIKERILNESVRLFFKRGVRTVTMSEIASQTGISKRTLYELFKDKDELLGECVNKIIKESNQRAMEFFQSHDNIILGFLIMYEQNLKYISQMNRTAISDISKYYPEIYQQFNDNSKKLGQMYENVLREGIKTGYIRHDINVEIVVELFQSQIKQVLEDDEMIFAKYPLSEYMLHIIINFARGISTEKGLELIDDFIKSNSSKE